LSAHETGVSLRWRVIYDMTQKILFVWKGVTPYITEQGVDNTLSFISHHSAPGSLVIFDYVLQPVIEGAFRYYKCREVAAIVASKGEPWIFGIGEGEAEHFVNQRGLVVLSDLGPDELTQQYLVQSDGSIDGRMLECVRILHASVPNSTSKKK